VHNANAFAVTQRIPQELLQPGSQPESRKRSREDSASQSETSMPPQPSGSTLDVNRMSMVIIYDIGFIDLSVFRSNPGGLSLAFVDLDHQDLFNFGPTAPEVPTYHRSGDIPTVPEVGGSGARPAKKARANKSKAEKK
jgi:hypothetical protein